MQVLVAGSNGTTGRHIVRKLVARGHHVRAMIRDAEQAETLRSLGGDPVVADLTEDLSHAVRGCEAAIFAAGSKGKQLEEVDKNGAIRLIDTCRQHGVDRFVMLSSLGADDPTQGPNDLEPYLEAKQAADEHLRASGLTYTIVRPGELSDADEQGTISAAETLDDRDGSVARADVAEAIVAALETTAVKGRTFEMLSGDVQIERALRTL